MKKILLSKSFILCLLIITNFMIVFLAFIPNFVTTTTGKSNLPPFEPNTLTTTEQMPTARKEFVIYRGTLVDYLYMSATIVPNEDTSHALFICSSVKDGIFVGRYLNKGEVIGYDSESNEIICDVKGTIVEINEESSSYEVKVYCPTKYLISCEIDQAYYYKLAEYLDIIESYLDISGNKFKIEFLGLDYLGGVQNGKVGLFYSFIDNDSFLVKNSYGSVALKVIEYTDVFYMDKEAFEGFDNPEGINKSFLYKDGDEIIYVGVKALYDCQDYYVINGKNIKEGMVLYDEYR